MTMTRIRRWAALVAASVLIAPALLATPASAEAARPAPAWTVNKAASRLGFQSSQSGTAFTGRFERWAADIRFDPKNLAGSSVTVRIAMTSARTGASERDQALPGADWFAAAKFAQASWTAKNFKDLGGGRYQGLGQLTMRGVTRPLVVTFQLAITGNQAKMVGSAVIDRHAFGVGQGQFASADAVPFAVKLDIVVQAKRG